MADVARRPLRLTRRTAQTGLEYAENALPNYKNVNVVLKAAPVQHVRSALGLIGNKKATAQMVTTGKGGLGVRKQNDATKDKPVLVKPKLAGKPAELKTGLPVREKKEAVPPTAGTTKPGVIRRIANILSAQKAQPEAKPKQAVTLAAPKTRIAVKPTVRPKPGRVEAQGSQPDLSGFSQEEKANLEKLNKADSEDAQYVAIYVQDIFSYMRHLEVVYCIPDAYIKQCKFMTNLMRATVVDWLVGVHRQFKLMPETLYLTVSIFDRYMLTAPATPKSQLQLVGVTSLLIASKYEEILCPTIADCVYVTDNTYTKKQVVEMESRILGGLAFSIGRPLPLQFLRRYTKVADATYKEHCAAKYFMELQLVRHEMCHVRPSLQAAAALCLSLLVNLDQDLYGEYKQADKSPSDTLKRLWSPPLHYFSGFSFAEVEQAVKQLALVVLKGHSSTLQNVRKKYSTKSVSETSQLVEGHLDRIKSIRD
ncbi:G2/mitotic-specific cyclin-B2-like [Cloeon dipterum]|uniref:G2/mitotic-specific cyclin-B2-like n=1 Tax=Cloeon dipterum TaxID=197152 RepID=UPI00321F8CFE